MNRYGYEMNIPDLCNFLSLDTKMEIWEGDNQHFRGEMREITQEWMDTVGYRLYIVGVYQTNYQYLVVLVGR